MKIRYLQQGIDICESIGACNDSTFTMLVRYCLCFTSMVAIITYVPQFSLQASHTMKNVDEILKSAQAYPPYARKWKAMRKFKGYDYQPLVAKGKRE